MITYIYINSNLVSFRNVKAATEEPSLYTYPPTEHLLDDQEDHANLQRIIYSCLIKRAFSFKFKGKSMETETT